jgi:two-component system, cell cycle response regulator
MRILIAEDDLTSRIILTTILSKWGHEPLAVEDGSSAWDIMQQSDAPRLAVLDWDMPGLDGLEVCRRIREACNDNPPYLIILTAKGEKADIVKGLDAGANDYISKPYDNDELQARINVGGRMLALQTDLLEARDALAYEATHDPLTGALNRRAILGTLEKELKRSGRRNSALTIGLCDIDHFKQVNDTYGHQVGDSVLCDFVKAIRSSLRGYDLVGRYGGEEFLVVAPDAVASVQEGLYERLRYRAAHIRTATPSGAVGITVSIGVAGVIGKTTVDRLLADADAALYRAKDAGRNRIEYASAAPNNAGLIGCRKRLK